MLEKPTACDKSRLTLFGGDEGWNADDWTSSDDRVRGGKSQSHLCLNTDNTTATFYGTLDIRTLGGAGFASQRTTGDEGRKWDLSAYAGIEICIEEGDDKRYTFNLKDDVLEDKDPETGRERATISWECDFDLSDAADARSDGTKKIFFPWKAFTPTYRGKVQKDVEPLKTESVKRMSLMMRSFFGTQEGDFSLTVKSICALDEAPAPPPRSLPPAVEEDSKVADPRVLESGLPNSSDQPNRPGEFTLRIFGREYRIHKVNAYLIAFVITAEVLYYLAGYL